MIDHDILRRPPDDPTGSGATLSFDELASTLDIFAPDLWSDLAQDPNSSSMSRASPMHNDNPNSSLGCHRDLDDSFAWTLSVPHGAPSASTLFTWPPPINNQLLWLDKQYPEVIANAADSLDRPFSVVGNTSLFGADEAVFPHLELAPDSLAAISLIPTPSGSTFQARPPSFVDDWGGPYPAIELVDLLELKQSLNHHEATWAYSAIPASSPYAPDPPDSLDSAAPVTPPETSILNPRSDQAVCVPEVPPPPPDSPPALSPALTDSSGAESSSGDEMLSEPPLFLGPRPANGAPVPAASNLPPALLPDGDGLKLKAEIDPFVDSLAMLRQHRGSGPSLVKLKCPWCDKSSRRPSELKQHMYAHRGLILYPCPRPGCSHVSNRSTNLRRHMNHCKVSGVSDDGSLSEPRVS
ncbi:hypothetical protein FRC08_003553 [Ceratobasidium sp. 394]|nr:hypothetical protein FRC08_003553 [Ceratobasidium sp. 394]